jgi:hypothetical protein
MDERQGRVSRARGSCLRRCETPGQRRVLSVRTAIRPRGIKAAGDAFDDALCLQTGTGIRCETAEIHGAHARAICPIPVRAAWTCA